MSSGVVEVLEVLEPGLLTTVQDGGRPGLAGEGVSRGGAADPWSLAVANALVGNPPDVAALELTLLGPTLRALRTVTVGLAGTIAGRVLGSEATLAPGNAVTLRAGETLCLDRPLTGARGYLAVPGGIDVPVVLGSRSTALGAGFGGFEGRALRAGDRVRAGAGPADLEPGPRRWPGDAAPLTGPIRVLPGPHAADLGPDAFETLIAAAWTVNAASDRMGLRLDGPVIPGPPTGQFATLAVVPGTNQVPPDGRPIVLLVDHQPTGGYPVLAVVISSDLAALGQLAPGAGLRFAATDEPAAREALVDRRRAFDEARAALRDGEPWDELWRWARCSVDIRPATESDSAAIKSLIHEAGINPRDLDWRRFLVADAGEVVACAQVRVHKQGTRELASVAVREARRGEGLGRRISEAMIASEPVRPLFLYAEAANMPYWTKFAFVEVEDAALPPDMRRAVLATRRLIRAYNLVTRHHYRIVVMRRDDP